MATKVKGTVDPSNMDVDQWLNIFMSSVFRHQSQELAEAIARMARILSTGTIEVNDSLVPFMACRLLPLNKNAVLRQIGIGECLRRIIGKAVLTILRDDIIENAGSLQSCAGVKGGIEANIHAVEELYDDEESQDLIQMNASNVFNRLNRKNLLMNIHVL